MRHCVEMTDRGPPLVPSNRGRNAQTGDYLRGQHWHVSDQLSQVHVALDESKQDFERDRLMLHEISVRSDSGRALDFALNVEQLRTLRCLLKRRRAAGWELESLMGHVTLLAPQTGDPVALPLCLPIRSQVLSSTGTSLDQCTCRARGFCGSHDF